MQMTSDDRSSRSPILIIKRERKPQGHYVTVVLSPSMSEKEKSGLRTVANPIYKYRKSHASERRNYEERIQMKILLLFITDCIHKKIKE